jgi:hypothetical protein
LDEKGRIRLPLILDFEKGVEDQLTALTHQARLWPRRRGSATPITHHPRLWRNRRGSVNPSYLSILGFGEIEENQLTFLPINLDLGRRRRGSFNPSYPSS